MSLVCPSICCFPAPSSLYSVHLQFRQLRTKAASIGSSTAGFPEQPVDDDVLSRRKRRSVAGIDQEELLDPEKLADPDSFFLEINGVRIHHKTWHHESEQEVNEAALHARSDGSARVGLPMILLHGFGASVFSWNRVMKPLARMIGSKVLAFDRPAFGLTSRTSYFENKGTDGSDAKPLNPYSVAFSVLATLSFIDTLVAGKAILMGHSAGCLVAVNTYFESPEKVAALILVAPAIFAPFFMKKDEKFGDVGSEKNREEEVSHSGANENPFSGIWRGLCKLYGVIAGFVLNMLKKMTYMARSLYAKAVAAILRSAFAVMLVRMIMDKFGILAVRNAWYDANQVTDHVIQGYTKPLRAKGWDKALLEYTLAMLIDSSSISKPPLSKRLAEITCPVLVVTGDTDRLVPSWNSRRLAQAIPGSTFEIINKCGHVPQEEKPEEFLTIIDKFLCSVFDPKGGQFAEVAA